jgi:putative phosphoesterase
MIRVGVVSDTHICAGNELPKGLFSALADMDLLLHAGDLVKLAVLERLKEIVPEVHAVWGNMDPADVRRALPEKEVVRIKKFHIGLTHGYGPASNLIHTVKEKFRHQHLDCIVYGHSHFPRNEVHQGIIYFNPGSPTDKFFAPYNSYGLLEIDNKIEAKIIKLRY